MYRCSSPWKSYFARSTNLCISRIVIKRSCVSASQPFISQISWLAPIANSLIRLLIVAIYTVSKARALWHLRTSWWRKSKNQRRKVRKWIRDSCKKVPRLHTQMTCPTSSAAHPLIIRVMDQIVADRTAESASRIYRPFKWSTKKKRIWDVEAAKTAEIQSIAEL